MSLGNPPEYRAFPLTQWSLVDRAGSISSDLGFHALEELVTRYREALRSHLIFIKKLSPDRADDTIQGFLADKFLQSDLLARADRGKGKFRTYLLTSMERYYLSVVRKETALKRSPGAGMVAGLDQVTDVASDAPTTSDVFDTAWARELIDQSLDRVRGDLESSARASYWEIFQGRVVTPILEGGSTENYEALVKRLGFASPMQASNALITAKRMFVRKLREVVSEYVKDEVEIDRELEELQAILAGAAG